MGIAIKKQEMRAAIYNPYLDTLGGGERYTVSFAKVLLENGWSVDIEWPNSEIKKNIEDRFGINVAGINFVPDIKKGEGYDLCFWVSDGSIPLLHSRKNFLHFQVPFHKIGGNSLLNKMKLIRIDRIICNSQFTKKVIDKEFGVESIVVYPPVDTEKIKSKRKENIILYVGRFSTLKQSKHQDILIDAFKNLYDVGAKDWVLILAGGTDIGVGNYLNELKNKAKNYPVEIIENPNFKKIIDLYGKAKIFWSASGFGENEQENPEKVEHFGITTVEAMSAGAVPVVFGVGGNKEIVRDGENGLIWNTSDGLVAITKNLIENKKKMKSLSERSHLDSFLYAFNRFKNEIKKLL